MITIALRILNQVVLGSIYKINQNKGMPFVSIFRCWPVDVDIYFHMNNASYLRTAELSRWRLFSASGAFTKSTADWKFIVVENNVNYLKSIAPFQAYTIHTTVTTSDNKWLHYEHVFRHPTKDIIYATVDARAVVKESSGKTVPVTAWKANNPWLSNHLKERESKQ